MIDKKSLCDAFCGDLELTEVPAGVAVRTGFSTKSGDAIGFYVVGDQFDRNKFRIEDSGLIIPELEASGVDLERGTRADAFRKLLAEYDAEFDVDALEIHTKSVSNLELPSAAMRFMALLLRIQDLELLTPGQVENAFREDAEKAIKQSFADKASRLEFNVAPSNELAEFVADAVIASSNEVVAVYLGTHEARVDESVMAWMENRHLEGNVRVVLLLENGKPSNISARAVRRAMNRLDATTAFRGDEVQSMAKIGSIAGIHNVGTRH
jgi:hypothetical protein